MKTKLVVVGSLNMDLIVRSPRFPAPGETLLGGNFSTAPGGKGANQAVAAARLDAEVTMVGRVGRDSFGETMLSSLSASGVCCDTIVRDSHQPTGVAMITVDAAGQNTIVVCSGANHQLTCADIAIAQKAISEADALLLQLESPIDAVICAAQMAHRAGVKVILNPAPAQVLPPALLCCVDILIPNGIEIGQLSGFDVQDRKSAINAARAILQSSNVENIIVTLGSGGALIVNQTESLHSPGFAVSPVDTTAAGDAFVGAFASRWIMGATLAQAVRFANAAGALATTKLGAQPSLPHLAEVNKFLKG